MRFTNRLVQLWGNSPTRESPKLRRSTWRWGIRISVCFCSSIWKLPSKISSSCRCRLLRLQGMMPWEVISTSAANISWLMMLSVRLVRSLWRTGSLETRLTILLFRSRITTKTSTKSLPSWISSSTSNSRNSRLSLRSSRGRTSRVASSLSKNLYSSKSQGNWSSLPCSQTGTKSW